MKIAHRKPRFCVWEVTLNCNMRCLHCGSYAGASRVNELSLEEAFSVADQLADLGCERLTLSGGELLLRADWDKIAERLIMRGIRVGIISNGFFMDRNMGKITRLRRLELVAMSIDGLRDTHDRFRRVEGSYDRVIAAFKELKRLNIPVAAVTSISQWNLRELEGLYEVLAPIGVYAWQLQPLFGGGRMREHPELMPGPEDLETIARFIISKKKAGRMLVYPADGVGYFTELDAPMRGYLWQGCQAGLQVIGIEANGNVKGCLSLNPEALEDNPFVEGNVRKQTLREIWEDPTKFQYNRRFDYRKLRGFCKTCPHVKQCRCGCSAQAYFATGTIYDSPYCMYAARCNPGGKKNRQIGLSWGA